MEVKMIWSFVLLSFTTKCWSQTLTQSEAAVITPGGSHRLTCTASGLNFDPYWMGWELDKQNQAPIDCPTADEVEATKPSQTTYRTTPRDRYRWLKKDFTSPCTDFSGPDVTNGAVNLHTPLEYFQSSSHEAKSHLPLSVHINGCNQL
ncbi:hypothetical protein SRHO_G00190890 [Serrasalmus rhombeus]